jgi:predicted DNA-binding transcriptional regulator YafY
MSKADNMLSILWLLKTRKRMTAKEIAETLEIHIRTVYRYIDGLCVSGVPIEAESGHDGGYRLPDHFRDVPLFFDLEEQKALAQAAVFAQEAGYPYATVLERALTKLQRNANREQWDQVNRHLSGFDVIPGPGQTGLDSFLRIIEQAVSDGRTICMEYLRGHDQAPSARHLNPYGLIHWRGKWYVVGFCHLRGEIRSFRMDRIRTLSETDRTFERPVSFSPRQFLLQNLLPDPAKPESLVTVVIRGKWEALNELCDHWLFGHGLMERTDAEARFQLQEEAIRTMVPYYLFSFGRAVQVIEPDLLKQRMIQISEGLLEHYRVAAIH